MNLFQETITFKKVINTETIRLFEQGGSTLKRIGVLTVEKQSDLTTTLVMYKAMKARFRLHQFWEEYRSGKFVSEKK